MESSTPAPSSPISAKTKKTIWKRAAAVVGILLMAYLVLAYLIMPTFWKRYAHRHPGLEDIPDITHTKYGLPGDPLNVALVGNKNQVMMIMVAAKWYPADPLTLRSCLEIAEASVLKRPYKDAPVSNLYLFGRKQDLAFEQAVGNNPRKRHHVRFWRAEKEDDEGRPVWVGAAIFDEHVGLSKKTGQITHVTGADIDAERDFLFRDLKATGELAEEYFIDAFHKTLKGVTGGGDPWFTDGRLEVGIVK
jgi:hypothetical protein